MSTTRVVYGTLLNAKGQPLANVTVSIHLVSHQFIGGGKLIVKSIVSTKTDQNGYWEVPLVPNDTMEDTNSFYIVTIGEPNVIYRRRYFIRVPSGDTPVSFDSIRVYPAGLPKPVSPEEVVSSIAVINQQPMKGQITFIAGSGIELQQNTDAKTIKIINTGGGGGGGGSHELLSDTHTDTEPASVQRGMLIVGKLVSSVVKWAGLLLGSSGKFLKSDGADAVWGDVSWDEVQNKPSTFPPSPHTHVKADITDFAHTHPLTELQQSGATTGQVPKWSGTQWQAGNVDWNEVTNKPSTFPPEPHNHPRSDIVDFFSTPFWNNIPDKPSTFPPEPHSHDAADITSGRLSASRLPTSPTANRFLVVRNANSDPTYDTIQVADLPSHTHTKSQITDLETITTTPTANAVPKADANAKIATGWIPQGHNSGLDADTVDGQHASTFAPASHTHTKSDITDFAHAASHQAGGSDELTGNLNANARVGVAREGTLVGTRRQVNFRQGAGVSIDAEDEAANERVNVTIRSRVDINTHTGTAYTLQLSDAGNLVQMNNSSANTVTIPTNTSVPFPVGTRIIVQKYGTGDTTIQADTGVTLRDPNNQATITTQYDLRVLLKIGTDEWVVI